MRTVSLGCCIARLDASTERMTIVSPSVVYDGVFSPAESVTICGKNHIDILIKSLNE